MTLADLLGLSFKASISFIVFKLGTLGLTTHERGKETEKGEGRMRTFIFVLAAIVPAFVPIDRAGARRDVRFLG